MIRVMMCLRLVRLRLRIRSRHISSRCLIIIRIRCCMCLRCRFVRFRRLRSSCGRFMLRLMIILSVVALLLVCVALCCF